MMMTSMELTERKSFSTWMNKFVALFEFAQIFLSRTSQRKISIEIGSRISDHARANHSSHLPDIHARYFLKHFPLENSIGKKRRRRESLIILTKKISLRLESRMKWLKISTRRFFFLFSLICWMPIFWFYFHLLLRSTSGLGSIRNTCL